MARQFEVEAMKAVLELWVTKKSKALGADLHQYITDDDRNDVAIDLIDALDDAREKEK